MGVAHVRTQASIAGRLAGALAIGSGLAYLAYLFVEPALRDAAITAWNLLIIPAAVYLGVALTRRGPLAAALGTAAGLTASLLWAFSYRSASLETWWIGLAAIWWVALGRLLWSERRALAIFTLILGAAAAMDAVLTAINAPMPIYALGGFKIPLTNVWSFWVGIALLREPLFDTERLERATGRIGPDAWALVGGALWIACAVGWTFAHGSTQQPRGATLLGFGALEFTRLFAVPAALWLIALWSSPRRSLTMRRRLARFAYRTALLGALLVMTGAIAQTSIVNPNRDFSHPAVQGGFLVFIAGLFPVLAVAMALLSIARPSGAPRRLRAGYLMAAVTSPLPVLAFGLAGVSDGSLAWDVAIATLHAAPGIGWLALSDHLHLHDG